MTDKAPEDTKPQVDAKPDPGEQINIKVRLVLLRYSARPSVLPFFIPKISLIPRFAVS